VAGAPKYDAARRGHREGRASGGSGIVRIE
jgi:hypothetical protein